MSGNGEKDLFRPAALQHRFAQRPERLFVSTSFSSKLLSVGAAITFAVLMSVVAFGRIPESLPIRGVLVSAVGAHRVLAPVDGRVLHIYAPFGSKVRRGQPMLLLTPDAPIGAQPVRVVAPDDGELSELDVTDGGEVSAKSLLGIITPTDIHLTGIILVPGSAVDYVDRGRRLRIRFDDFPYERYGTVPAFVSSISAVAADAQERASVGVSPTSRNAFYRAGIELVDTSVFADGQERPLHLGMLFSTAISRAPRPVWQFLTGTPQRAAGDEGNVKR